MADNGTKVAIWVPIIAGIATVAAAIVTGAFNISVARIDAPSSRPQTPQRTTESIAPKTIAPSAGEQKTPLPSEQPAPLRPVKPPAPGSNQEQNILSSRYQLPPPQLQPAETSANDPTRRGESLSAQGGAQSRETPAAISYFGYWTSDPDRITAISYSGFPNVVTQNRALEAYFRLIHNASPRADGQALVSRTLVLNAEDIDVSVEGCYHAIQISISYYFKDPRGKRMTEDRIAKGRPACISNDAEQPYRDATESAIAKLASAID
jgi:hypothetical protein